MMNPTVIPFFIGNILFYPLVIWHSHGKSLINGGLMGKSSINDCFMKTIWLVVWNICIIFPIIFGIIIPTDWRWFLLKMNFYFLHGKSTTTGESIKGLFLAFFRGSLSKSMLWKLLNHHESLSLVSMILSGHDKSSCFWVLIRVNHDRLAEAPPIHKLPAIYICSLSYIPGWLYIPLKLNT